MSISSIGNPILAQPYPTAKPTQGASDQASAIDGSQAPSAPAASTVTLSADAQAMASLNAMGVTIALVPASTLSSGLQRPLFPGGASGSISAASFDAVVEGLGATGQQASEAFTSADSNDDGSVSNSELLGTMNATYNSFNPAAQRLLQLMDMNHDGAVSGTEFVTFETAMVQAEVPVSQSAPGPTTAGP